MLSNPVTPGLMPAAVQCELLTKLYCDKRKGLATTSLHVAVRLKPKGRGYEAQFLVEASHFFFCYAVEDHDTMITLQSARAFALFLELGSSLVEFLLKDRI